MIVVTTIAVYAQMWSHGFVSYDDNVYIIYNPHIRNGFTPEAWHWLWTEPRGGTWNPLVWITVLVDMELYGLENPGGHHMTNLLLHVLTTLLLFQALKMMTDRPLASALVAGLFALHPLHVESVAWATERKDTLSGFFWMAAMVAYAWYARRPSTWRYSLVTLAFVAGLLSKSLLVTLPCALLLLDVWPLKRLKLPDSKGWNWAENRRCVWEKVPWLALVPAICVMTIYAQKAMDALGRLESYPMSVRLENAVVSYVVYMAKTVWPSRLQVFYPHPLHTTPWWQAAGALLLLVAVSYLAWHWRRRHPYVGVGWLWYLGTMLPMIGIVQVGRQAMADRYSYIPLIGLFVVAVWGLEELTRSQRVLASVGAGVLLAFSVCTWRQVGYWKSTLTLAGHSLAVNPANTEAKEILIWEYQAQAVNLISTGRLEEAYSLYEKALALAPENANIHNDYGNALYMGGHVNKALDHFREAVRLSPSLESAAKNLKMAEAGRSPPR